jgi:ABC-2 type transport system ATP-binding protein
MTTISVSNLVKDFGHVRALDGVDLRVEPGEVHGFLGPNGAGKSTTIRILLGLLRADSGQVRLLGGDPWTEAVELHRRLAYVPGDVSLWPSLSGGEAIDVLARLRGGFDRARRDALCERFDLDPTKRCRTYSKGNRQKVAIVAALASDVELYLFDEPTSGLDPLMETIFQQCVREASEQGRTVLLSSHLMAQVEALCQRVSIIRRGRIVQSDTLQAMRHLTRTAVTAETGARPGGLAALEGIHDLEVRDLDGAEGRGRPDRGGTRVRFAVDTPQLDAALGELHRVGVRRLVSQPPSLEQLFLRHYGDDLAADTSDVEVAR